MYFVGQFAQLKAQFFNNCKVFEVGSHDINGSVRALFKNCSYVGIDVGPGPGVDLVCQGQDYRGADDSFDTVISCECMEHNPAWRETFQNMVRVCRPGGLALMTCAGIGRTEHGTTMTAPDLSRNTLDEGWDYYGNLSAKDFRSAFPLDRWFVDHGFWINWDASDLYFAGIKRGSDQEGPDQVRWEKISAAIDRWLQSENSTSRARYCRFAATLIGDGGIATLRRIRDRARGFANRR
jgi:SAM-dependent methyltransferase